MEKDRSFWESRNEYKKPNERILNESKKEKPPTYFYEQYPYMPAEVELGAEVNMMIMQIREEICEKTIERAYKNYFESQIIPFTVHCIKQSLRKIINWMYLAKEVGPNWTADAEPEPAPIDSFCSSLVPNIQDGFQALYVDEVPHIDDIERSLGSISSLPYALPEEVRVKKKKKKKSKISVTVESDKPRSPFPSLSIKSRSTYSKSMGYGESRSQRHKYVRQLANYIHPRTFHRNLYSVMKSGFVRELRAVKVMRCGGREKADSWAPSNRPHYYLGVTNLTSCNVCVG